MILLALFPLITFFSLFLFMLARQSQPLDSIKAWQESFLFAALFWSGFIVLGTELLNLVKGLTTTGIVLLWLIGLFCLGFLHWKKKSFKLGWQRFILLFKQVRLDWFDRIFLGVILAALLILFITGIMSPPNIHDVLSYHMSRVMHWAQNRSINFYPTANTWQLWNPPFNEYSQLHWQLLTGSDVLSSFPQWCYLVFILVVVSATGNLMGVRRRGQILAALFILTVPIVVLQASGAKNDIVLSFFIAALMYFVIKATTVVLTYTDWVGAGISVALALLTKGTFLPFALPLLAWLLASTLRKAGWKKAVLFAVIGLALILVTNSGHWLRNTDTFGMPLVSEDGKTHMNNRFGVKETLSNLSRHAVVQMNGKYGFINEALIAGLYKIHTWLDMPVFDPAITLGPHEFYYVPNREEVVGNPFHFAVTVLLLLFCLFGLISKNNRSKVVSFTILSVAAFAGAVLFSVIFRWQTWSTRFFIPYYVLFSPVFGFIFDRRFPKPLTLIPGIFLTIVMITPLINNHSRAFSWAEENRNCIWRLSRKGLLFANNQNIEGIVLELTQLMEASQCRSYGILMPRNVPEYILWASLKPHPSDYFLEHIQVNNETEKHATTGFDPCGIVLFEFTEMDRVDETKYHLIQRWNLDGKDKFSLFLTPAYSLERLH